MQARPGDELCLGVCILESLTEDLTLNNDESKHHAQLKFFQSLRYCVILASVLHGTWAMDEEFSKDPLLPSPLRYEEVRCLNCLFPLP